MRCKNCGWENEDGSMKCAKCNAPLKGSMVESARPSYESSADSRVLKGTISERKFFSRETETEEAVIQSREEVATVKNCPECGYQVSPNMKVCPACGYQFSPVAVAQQPIEPIKKTCPSCGNELVPGAKFCPHCGKSTRMGTVNVGPEAVPGTYFTLQAIPWENEQIQYSPVSYSGESVNLNRSNTDPNNNSITSKLQAVISYKDGKWFIEDKSDFNSTLIRVSRKMELQDGDVIVLGNRKFEFKG